MIAKWSVPKQDVPPMCRDPNHDGVDGILVTLPPVPAQIGIGAFPSRTSSGAGHGGNTCRRPVRDGRLKRDLRSLSGRMKCLNSRTPVRIRVAENESDEKVLVADAFEEIKPECQSESVEKGWS